MKIVSNGETMTATMDHFVIHWPIGSHMANVFYNGENDDVFSFAWEKDRASMLDFTTSLLTYLSE